MAKVGIISLGCPRNLVDSEIILGTLEERGHQIVDIDMAEVAVVNTCSFIEDAKRESVDTILDLIELKKSGRLKRIVAAGCLVERYRGKLADELSQIDAFIGVGDFIQSKPSRYHLTPPHYRYIKIQEGCGNSCSFCIIPKIRGPLKSRPMESVIKEVRSLPREVSEINIIGQDTTMYGLDLYKEYKLADLVERIAKLDKIKWIRLLYAHPGHLRDELIRVIKDYSCVCKYLDLPLQHVNARILKRMGRGSTKGEVISLIDRVRSQIPGIAIRTSFIVGFPGETEAEFAELLDFIKEARFEKLGVFTYSREEDTDAAGFPDQIPEDIKEARFSQIMSLQQDISAEMNRAALGRELEVLIDEAQKPSPGWFLARTQYDAPEVDGQIWVKSDTALPGQFLKVKITDTLEYDLVGEAL